MKTIIKRIAASVAIASFAAVVVFAQAATRINFARGASSATVNGTVAASGTKDYVLRARKGQQLTVSISSAACEGVSFQVFDGGTGQSLSEAVMEFDDELPGTDDYTLRVGNVDETNCRFALKVRVR